MTDPGFEIVGGAGPQEAAAILAAVALVLSEQAVAAALPPGRIGQGPWVLSGRPRSVAGPLRPRPTPAVPGWTLASDPPDREERV
ncbi:MAG: hypothetical protein ACE5KX_01900 [Acidimicrobiia bacterium]